MPVKRRTAKGRSHRITDAAIDAWLAGDYLALHAALGLKLWQISPLDIDGPEAPSADRGPNSVGPAYRESWPLAWELRLELEEAAACP